MDSKKKNYGYPTGQKALSKKSEKHKEEAPTWGSNPVLRKILEDIKQKLPIRKG